MFNKSQGRTQTQTMLTMSLDNTQQIDLPQNINIQELLAPITNLANAMNIDISQNIDKYLEEIIDEVTENMDFRTAAIIIQQTAMIYGKKVDYLNQLLENILLNQPQRKARKRRTEKQLINDFTLQKDFDLSQIPFEDFYQKCEQMQTKKGIQLMNKQITSLLQARQEMDNQKIEMGPIYNCLIYDDQLISIVQRQSLYIQQPQKTEQNDQIQQQPEINQQQEVQQEQQNYDDFQDADLNIEMLNTQNEIQQEQIQTQQTSSSIINKLDIQNFDISMLEQLGQYVKKNLNKFTEIKDDCKNDFKKYQYKRYKIQNVEHKLEVPQNGIIYKFQEQDQSFNDNNILMKYTVPNKLYKGIQTPIVQNYFDTTENDVGQLLRSQVVKDEQELQQEEVFNNYQDDQYQSQQSDIIQVQVEQKSIQSHTTSQSNTTIKSTATEKQPQQKRRIVQNLFTTDYIQWIKKLEVLIKKQNEFNVKKVENDILTKSQQKQTNLDQLSQQIGNTKTRCFVSALFLANEGKIDIKSQDDQILFDIKE